MIATVPTVTVFVATVNLAVLAPAATVTDAGTVAALRLLLANATTAPPAGAAALSVTVPVLSAPPVSRSEVRRVGTGGGFRVTATTLDAASETAVVVAPVPAA